MGYCLILQRKPYDLSNTSSYIHNRWIYCHSKYRFLKISWLEEWIWWYRAEYSHPTFNIFHRRHPDSLKTTL